MVQIMWSPAFIKCKKFSSKHPRTGIGSVFESNFRHNPIHETAKPRFIIERAVVFEDAGKHTLASLALLDKLFRSDEFVCKPHPSIVLKSEFRQHAVTIKEMRANTAYIEITGTISNVATSQASWQFAVHFIDVVIILFSVTVSPTIEQIALRVWVAAKRQVA